jgi:hypothetical protein
MIKQAWAVIEKGDKSFTHVVSKSQKKMIKYWLKVLGSHITLVIGVTHLTSPYEMGGGFGKSKDRVLCEFPCKDDYFVLLYFIYFWDI